MSALLRWAGRIGLLALMVWREARHEPWLSKLGVAYVAATRAKAPNDDDLFDKLFAPMQFTSLTYKQDPQLTWWPRETVEWAECLKAAAYALLGLAANPAPDATHYFSAPLIKAPVAWGDVERVADLGTIHFYKERSRG